VPEPAAAAPHPHSLEAIAKANRLGVAPPSVFNLDGSPNKRSVANQAYLRAVEAERQIALSPRGNRGRRGQAV
jgi:hypothetical protein